MAWKRRCSPSAPSGEDSGERRRGKGKTELVWQPNSPPSLRFAHTFYRLPCRAAGWQLFTLTRRATRVGLSRFAGEAFGRWRGRHHASWAPESLSIRPTSRAAGKEGRLAPARPATPPRGFAAHVAVPECTDVLEDDRGPRAVTRPRGVVWMPSSSEPVAGGAEPSQGCACDRRSQRRIVGRPRRRALGGRLATSSALA